MALVGDVQRREGGVECAVELGLFGDGVCQLGLHGSTLAAGEVAAAQLGPQLLDVVVEDRSSCSPSVVKRRKAGAMPDWAGSRTPQAPRSGARGCRFCRVRLNSRAQARSSARQNWRDRGLVEPARVGMACWEIRRDGSGSDNPRG